MGSHCPALCCRHMSDSPSQRRFGTGRMFRSPLLRYTVFLLVAAQILLFGLLRAAPGLLNRMVEAPHSRAPKSFSIPAPSIAEEVTSIAENITSTAENSTSIAENSTSVAENTTSIAENSTPFLLRECALESWSYVPPPMDIRQVLEKSRPLPPTGPGSPVLASSNWDGAANAELASRLHSLQLYPLERLQRWHKQPHVSCSSGHVASA